MLILEQMNAKKGFCFLVIFVLLLQSCANIVPPQGGSKDTSPPKILSINPADSSIGKRINRIEFKFDEYVSVSNVATELITSPILPIPLQVVANGKTVIVKIPDSILQPNTTYKFSFGKSILDVHENNAAQNVQYTFTTGKYFDSLKIEGQVMNAFTGKYDSSATVLLYDVSKNDSIVAREKPMYAIHVEPKGHFLINGLPSKNFKVYAIRDLNNNLMYDGGDEWIGFVEKSIAANENTTEKIILYTFAETNTQSKSTNKPVDSKRERGNTANKVKNISYETNIDTSDFKKRTFGINEKIKLKFNQKFNSINSSKINLTYDSSNIEIEANLTSTLDTNESCIDIHSKWKENTVFTLRLLQGFVADSAFSSLSPAKFKFRTLQKSDYAQLTINFPSKYFGNHFIAEIFTEEATIYSKPISDSTLKLEGLSPGTYQLKIIKDDNKNGQWDKGDLFKKNQPEFVIPYPHIIMLKSGWQNEIDFGEKIRNIPKNNLSNK